MRHYDKQESLKPAAVLLQIRESDKIAHRDLQKRLNIHPSPSDFKNGELFQILRDLEEAGLIEVLGSLPESYRSKGSTEEICYRVTPKLHTIQTALQLSLHRLKDDAKERHREAAIRIRQVAEDLEVEMPDVGYKTDTITSFRELGDCLQAGCYIATLALGGKLLELAVKHHMIMNDQPFEDNWMLGTLLQKLKENETVYIDPAIRNVANVINASRIPAVHAKREIPIPSEQQALMVVSAVLDVTQRLVLVPQSGKEA